MSLVHRIANLFSHTKVQREIDAELRSHIEMRIDDNLRAGMSAAQARRDALLRFGNPTVAREKTMAADTALYLESLWVDARLAIRQLQKSPGYALSAILTLALAIGVNSAVFSVVHATLLRQLPFEAPSRVFNLENNASTGLELNFGSKDYEASFNHTARAFQTVDGAAIYSTSGTNADLGGVSMRLLTTEASAGFLDVLGVHPQLGRGFRPSEDIPGEDRVALLSDRLWRQTLHSDPAVLGKTVKINGYSFTVAGILPARMDFPANTDLWTPTIFDEHTALREGGAFFAPVIVRIKSSVSPTQLRAEFNARALQSYAGKRNPAQDSMPILTPIAAELTKSIRSSLVLLFVAASLVLVVACANLAGLMLVRGSSRRAEFAVRAALGAARGRLVRQQLVESILIALGGGVLGVAFANAALRLLFIFRPVALDAFQPPAIDTGVLAFTAVVALVSGLVFGVAPAWQAGREDPLSALKLGVWRASASGTLFRKVLVSGEIGLAVVLLIAAGLLLRTLGNMSKVPLGFDTQGILSFSISVHGAPYEIDEHTSTALSGLYSRLLDRLRALPGVNSAAAVSSAPLDTRADMLLPVSSSVPAAKPVAAAPRFVSAGYFGLMGIPILKGRDFSSNDTRTSAPVLIVTRDVAEKLWPGQDPIGQTMNCFWYCKVAPIVVGVVAPSRRFGPRGDLIPEYYMTYLQRDWSYMTFLLRTQGDLAALAPEVRRTVASVEPMQPLYDLTTMRQRLNDNESLVRFELFTTSVFAILSALLALIGLYGLIAYTVTQRTREIGLRIALGAQRKNIHFAVLRESAYLTGIGIATGLLASFVVTRSLSATLYGVTTHDPLTFSLVLLLLLAGSLFASLIPAYRAASVEPMQALRSE